MWIPQIHHTSACVLYVYQCFLYTKEEYGFSSSPRTNLPAWGQYCTHWECIVEKPLSTKKIQWSLRSWEAPKTNSLHSTVLLDFTILLFCILDSHSQTMGAEFSLHTVFLLLQGPILLALTIPRLTGSWARDNVAGQVGPHTRLMIHHGTICRVKCSPKIVRYYSSGL